MLQSSPAWLRATACALIGAALTATPTSARKFSNPFVTKQTFISSLFLSSCFFLFLPSLLLNAHLLCVYHFSLLPILPPLPRRFPRWCAEDSVAHCAKYVSYPQQECQSKLVKEKAECDCELCKIMHNEARECICLATLEEDSDLDSLLEYF